MKYKLVAFDVDGTLIDNIEYSWQLFHEAFGADLNARETAKNDYYSGKITYLQWAEHDIGLWRKMNVNKKDFIAAMNNICLMKGCKETLIELKKRGYKLAIISGSINVILDHLLPEYNELFDHVYISRIFFDPDGNIKDVKATAYDMEHKATALKEICKKENISLKECVFVGDHHNDIKVCEIAGLSIGFNCNSSELREVVDVCVEKRDVREILRYIE